MQLREKIFRFYHKNSYRIVMSKSKLLNSEDKCWFVSQFSRVADLLRELSAADVVFSRFKNVVNVSQD